MHIPTSARLCAVVVALSFCLAPAGYGEDSQQANQGSSGVTVTMDGLTCGPSPAATSFQAAEFAIAVNTITAAGGAGAGAGKTTFTDVAILKPSDSCSLPLFSLGATGQIIKQVVINAKGANGGFTLTLENVQVISSTLNGSAPSIASDEVLDLSYAAITITDASGHTTGRIVRQTGSIPFSPFFKPDNNVV